MLPRLQPPSRALLCFPEDQELLWALGATPEPSWLSQSQLLCEWQVREALSLRALAVPGSTMCLLGTWLGKPRFPSRVGMRVAGKALT